jgi:hypothetical protein
MRYFSDALHVRLDWLSGITLGITCLGDESSGFNMLSSKPKYAVTI